MFGDVSVCWCVQNKIHNMIMMVSVYVFGGVIVSRTMFRMLLCVLWGCFCSGLCVQCDV